MHQDLRVVIRIIQSRADARSPGQQRAPEGDDRCYPQHDTELGLLPPRPGRRGHMARALHHAGRSVIGGRSPGLLRRPHGAPESDSSLRCACSKHRTRGMRPKFRSVAAGEYGSGADGARPGPVGRVFVIFKYFGLWGFFPMASCSALALCIVSSGRNT